MLQRYDISMDVKENLLSIREFSVLGKLSKKRENFEPTKAEYFFLHEATYNGDTVRAAINGGTEAVISELRSDGFFPIRSLAEIIAGKVTEIFNNNSDTFSEIFFDDMTVFSKNDEDENKFSMKNPG